MIEVSSYSVREGDIWELSEAAFTAKPTVGTTVVSTVTGKKWTVA